MREPQRAIHADTLKEAAQMEARYGSSQRALDRLDNLRAIGDEASWALAASTPTAAFVAIRRGDLEAAARLIDRVDPMHRPKYPVTRRMFWR